MAKLPCFAAALVVLSTTAMAQTPDFNAAARIREFTPAELREIEAINYRVNHDPALMRLTQADPSCGAYALNKAYGLTMRGFGRDLVAIAIVVVPDGQTHAVAEIKATKNGVPVTYVLDSLRTETRTRAQLEADGYAWEFEFALNAPAPPLQRAKSYAAEVVAHLAAAE